MNVLKVCTTSITLMGFLCSAAVAADAIKGRELFNDPKLGNGASGKSCNSCHADGAGLEETGGKNKFVVMGKTVFRLEEAVNLCIEHRMKGRALDPKSPAMADIIAYINSLKGKAPALAPKKRAVSTGC